MIATRLKLINLVLDRCFHWHKTITGMAKLLEWKSQTPHLCFVETISTLLACLQLFGLLVTVGKITMACLLLLCLVETST